MKILDILNESAMVKGWTAVTHMDGKETSKEFTDKAKLVAHVKSELEKGAHKTKSHVLKGDEKTPFGMYAEAKRAKEGAPKKEDDEVEENEEKSSKINTVKFDVYKDKKHIDTVHYSEKMSADEVKSDLIKHDGHDSDIKVIKRKK